MSKGSGEGAPPKAPGQPTRARPATAPAAGKVARRAAIVDEDRAARTSLAKMLHAVGIDTEDFESPEAFCRALKGLNPELVFLNVGIMPAAAISVLAHLATQGYFGFVQLIGDSGAILEGIQAVGEEKRLIMLPALIKPLQPEAISALVERLQIGREAPGTARVKLQEALRRDSVEFWYQPKIDLRRGRVAGLEAFARIQHPSYGVLDTRAFLADASVPDLVKLSEWALYSAIQASLALAQAGMPQLFAVNIPVSALIKLSVPDIVRSQCEQLDHWQGLIIDITEDDAIRDIALAADIAKKFARVNVKLAIDHCGRAYSRLSLLKHLPFAEFKIDREFIANCGTDKANASLCENVIALAHNSNSDAVGVGVDAEADVVALKSMGCDLAQGFLLGRPVPESGLANFLRSRMAPQGSARQPRTSN
jgi:EAL domain-containing protein (putative c-di-GMP-specific phosphodiesterase class I)